MTVPSITPLPPAPLRSQSPATFTTTAETFVDALETFVEETNDAIAEINALDFATTTWKGAVRVATTAAGTIGSSFVNGATVDGVTLATGDRILIKNQAAPAENGVYTVNASGSPTRAADMNANNEVLGAVIFVIAGTTNANKIFYSTNTNAVTIGSSALNFAEFSSGSGYTDEQVRDVMGAALVAGRGVAITPSDGSDTITIANTLITGSASGNDPNPVSIPVVSSFSWVNQDSATASDSPAGLGILITNHANSEWHILEQNTPSTPFNVYLRIDAALLEASATNIANACAITLRNSSNSRLITFSNDFILRTTGTDNRLRFARWTDTTTLSADLLSSRMTDPRYWLRLNVTSTTITPYILFAGQWIQAASAETISTFISTVDKVGFGMRSDTGIDLCYGAVGNFGFTDPLA